VSLEDAQRRASHAEESSVQRMNDERAEWTAKVKALEVQVAGLTASLKEAKLEAKELKAQAVADLQRAKRDARAGLLPIETPDRVEKPTRRRSSVTQSLMPGAALDQHVLSGCMSSQGGFGSASSPAVPEAPPTPLVLELRVPVLDAEAPILLTVPLTVPLLAPPPDSSSSSPQRVLDTCNVAIGSHEQRAATEVAKELLAREEELERNNEERARRAAETAAKAKAAKATRQEASSSNAADAKTAAETKAAAKEAAARRKEIIERAEAEAAKMKSGGAAGKAKNTKSTRAANKPTPRGAADGIKAHAKKR